MKARGIIILLALAAFLICVMGWALLGRREPWARIRFTEARFSNGGTLTIAYQERVSSGACLHQTDFENGVKTGDSQSCGSSFFGWPDSGSGNMSFGLSSSDFLVTPSLLVETGKNYIVTPHDPLPLYDFTNRSGMRYQARFWVEQGR